MKTLLRFAVLGCAVVFATSLRAAEPVGIKNRMQGAAPCCAITAIDMKTGVVAMKDSKTGRITNVTVKNKAKLNGLRIGQMVGKNL